MDWSALLEIRVCMLDKVLQFATEAHSGQVRKYTGLPYVTHVQEVASIVAEHGGTDEMIAAALLHDTVEDTPTTFEDIRSRFGDDVTHFVWFLTDISRPEDGNRAVRKAMDRAHVARGPKEVQVIKLADMISNGKDILTNDPSFAKVYIPELRALLDSLTLVKDHPLYNKAMEIVDVAV